MTPLTEEEHIRLVELGNQFWNDLGDMAAKVIVQFPKEMEWEVETYLQDKCNIFSTNYTDKVRKLREEL